jgi:sec-independent protein translocase protein TatB
MKQLEAERLSFVSAMGIQVSLLSMGTPPTIEIGSLGMADSLILMVMALVVFGPRKLPQIGRQIGKLMYEFRKASNDFKFQMEEELRSAEEADRRKQEEERQRALALAAPAAPVNAVESSSASPYPGEGQYPPPDPTPAETQPEADTPRIMPPSVGEQVPAARPGSVASQAAEASAVPEQTDTTAADQAGNHG